MASFLYARIWVDEGVVVHPIPALPAPSDYTVACLRRDLGIAFAGAGITSSRLVLRDDGNCPVNDVSAPACGKPVVNHDVDFEDLELTDTAPFEVFLAATSIYSVSFPGHTNSILTLTVMLFTTDAIVTEIAPELAPLLLAVSRASDPSAAANDSAGEEGLLLCETPSASSSASPSPSPPSSPSLPCFGSQEDPFTDQTPGAIASALETSRLALAVHAKLDPMAARQQPLDDSQVKEIHLDEGEPETQAWEDEHARLLDLGPAWDPQGPACAFEDDDGFDASESSFSDEEEEDKADPASLEPSWRCGEDPLNPWGLSQASLCVLAARGWDPARFEDNLRTILLRSAFRRRVEDYLNALGGPAPGGGPPPCPPTASVAAPASEPDPGALQSAARRRRGDAQASPPFAAFRPAEALTPWGASGGEGSDGTGSPLPSEERHRTADRLR